jgi:hypothetical protein
MQRYKRRLKQVMPENRDRDLRFEIHAIEGGAESSESQCMIAEEEDADKRAEVERSSPETGERLELVRANARDLQNNMVRKM